jgi:eukaryotic-like serine/threonine-protein kinase
MVGPWRIVQVLGRGGSSRVFKVERNGRPYALKMALRPLSASRVELSEDEYVEEKGAYRRLAREAATLFSYSTHPNLLRVYAVDFWPDPSRGYAFIVTDYLDGDTWHQWRWRKGPHAAALVDTFSAVVRTVGVLHKRGTFHRDLKADNILIRRKDGRPFLIDFGTVRLPGALTRTLGLPEGVLHLSPPELLAYIRTEAWRRHVPFEGGAPADLYTLGVLLYQGLTDLHPFNPELPDKELLAAIATIPPVPPHLLNPLAPRSLSDITMRLLEKRPEDRYPNTDALLQALDKASENERKSPAWKVPLTPPEGTREAPLEGKQRIVQEVASEVEETQPLGDTDTQPREETREEVPPKERRTWRVGHLAVVSLLLLAVLFLASWVVRSTLLPSHTSEPTASVALEKGSVLMPTLTTSQESAPTRGNSSLRFLAVWLCTATGLGCPAAQVMPEPEDCSAEAQHNMFEVLKLYEGVRYWAIVDIHQPGDPNQEGTYRDGPIVGRVVQYDYSPPELPGGTLLYGRLWTGPGIQTRDGEEGVLGRYTEALLPDGRKLSVCIILGDPNDGRVAKEPGSKPGAVRLPRELPVFAVRRWL